MLSLFEFVEILLPVSIVVVVCVFFFSYSFIYPPFFYTCIYWEREIRVVVLHILILLACKHIHTLSNIYLHLHIHAFTQRQNTSIQIVLPLMLCFFHTIGSHITANKWNEMKQKPNIQQKKINAYQNWDSIFHEYRLLTWK